MTPFQIKNKYVTLKADRSALESLWDLIEQFVMPFRGEFFSSSNGEQSVDWRKRKLYDSTAVMAAQNLAAAIQSNLINPSTRWFDLKFRSNDLMSNDEAREWLEECASIIYYTLNESNFNREASESILDMVGFGTTVINEETKELDNGGLRLDFSSMPISEVVFEEDSDGGLVAVYRELNWTALQIIDKWGDDNPLIPQKVRDKLGTDDEGKDKFKIIFCIHKRDTDADLTKKVLAAKLRPYASRYIFFDDPADLAEEGGYYEMPSFIPRWRKTSGSKWGHSPSAVALADILTVNELVEVVLENAAKAVDPATFVTKKGLLSTLKLGRGGLTVVRSKDDIWEYNTSARFDVGALEIKRLQDQINKAFYVDQLDLKDSPAMTATEAQIRYELIQRLVGPTLSRFQTDWLNPCISRTFGILYRSDMLPEPPQVVKDAQAQFDIEYTGPMARSHKREIAISIQNWLQTLSEVSGVLPEVIDVPDPDKVATKLGILGGVPADIMRSDTEISEIRDERRKAQDAQAQAEMDKMKSEAAMNNANADKVSNGQ